MKNTTVLGQAIGAGLGGHGCDGPQDDQSAEHGTTDHRGLDRPVARSVSGRSSVGGAWLWFEGCGHVTDFLDEAKGAGYAFEAVVLVEGRCSLVECIHDDDSSCDGLGRDDDPLECVGKKYPTQAGTSEGLPRLTDFGSSSRTIRCPVSE